MLQQADDLTQRLRWLAVTGALFLGLVVAMGTLSSPEPIEEEVTAQVRELVQLVLNARIGSDDTDIVETGLLDSLALVELLVGIEREFNVQVELETLDLDNLRSVRSIAQMVFDTTHDQGPGAVTAAGEPDGA